MIALVTGGAGFIGSTLVDRLLGDGHEVIVVDDFSSGKAENLEAAQAAHPSRLTVHRMDIRDERARQAVADSNCDVVFHLAAQMNVRLSVSDPTYDADVNLRGGLNVLEGARAGGVRKFVFASSGGTIYGEAPDDAFPLDESAPQRPVSPYGVSKKAFGDYLFAYNRMHGMDYVALALANVYGPRQDARGEAGVVAIFARNLAGGEPCTIYGDGSATRDYVYVDDVIDAFVRAASTGTGLYNVGTGAETSTSDLYYSLAALAGVQAEPQWAPARTGEIERSALDSRRAQLELGWAPTVDLTEGLERVLASRQEHG